MTVILVALPCWCLQRGGGGGWSLDITTDVYLVVQLRRTSQPPLGVCLGKLLHNKKYIIIWLLNHTKKWSSYWRRFFSFFFVTNPQVKWSFRPLPEIIRFFLWELMQIQRPKCQNTYIPLLFIQQYGGWILNIF